MSYAITRQHYYYSGERVVEVSAGGLDYSGPDALVGKYPGEFKTFSNPVEAVETAITICKAWRTDSKRKDIKIAIGNSQGMGLEFKGSTFAEARKKAKQVLEKLPKCPSCGKIMESKSEKWTAGYICLNGDFLPDEKYNYCSEYCAEKASVWEEENDGDPCDDCDGVLLCKDCQNFKLLKEEA
jgi:hypothetical protein